jgi:hypothetical protein
VLARTFTLAFAFFLFTRTTARSDVVAPMPTVARDRGAVLTPTLVPAPTLVPTDAPVPTLVPTDAPPDVPTPTPTPICPKATADVPAVKAAANSSIFSRMDILLGRASAVAELNFLPNRFKSGVGGGVPG